MEVTGDSLICNAIIHDKIRNICTSRRKSINVLDVLQETLVVILIWASS